MNGPEEWRSVIGWEGFYEVSSLGAVRSLDRIVKMANRWGTVTARRSQGRTLAKAEDTFGYPQVVLSGEGRREYHRVHVLVCTAFNGPAPEGFEVAHADGDGTNNRVSNLRWASRRDNLEDRRRHGTLPLGDGHQSTKVSDATVAAIRAERGLTQSVMAKKYGISQTQVGRIIRQESRTERDARHK